MFGLLFTVIFITCRPMAAQDFQEERIGWVSVFPDHEKNIEKNLGEKISDLIFGEKQFILNKPMAVVGEMTSDYWILDQGLGTLVHVKNGKGKAVLLPKNIQPFPSLASMCKFSGNSLLFTDSRLDLVFIYKTEENEFIPLTKPGLVDQPTGITWLKKKNEIWIAETRQHRIAVLNPAGQILRYIGKRGKGPEEFNFPTYLWSDQQEKVYITDALNYRIQILDQDGKYISSLGKIGDATGYFSRPKGLATDSKGNIYVTDALFHVVQIFDHAGNFLYYFGSQGRNKGQFWMPSNVYVDENDYIYVSDTYNSRVQIYKLLSKQP